MFKIKLVIAVGLLALLRQVNGQCTGCASGTTGLVCINETSLEFCLNGAQTGVIASCDAGKVCDQGVCKIPSDTVTAECRSNKCNKCEGNYACVSKTEFALCEDNKVTNTVLPCPGNMICDISQAAFCVTCAGTPTCSNAVSEKPDPAVDYADSCANVQDEEYGFYSNIYDTTCKSYVFCEMNNAKLTSILYKCSSGYFDSVKKQCVSKKPSGCD